VVAYLALDAPVSHKCPPALGLAAVCRTG